MTFPFTCGDCGHLNHFAWSQIGQQVPCGGCGGSLTVPVPMEAMGPLAAAPRSLKFRCPDCRRKFSTKPELAGKKIRCTGCGSRFRVPADEAYTAPPSSQTIATKDPQSSESRGRTLPISGSVPRVDVRAVAGPRAPHTTPVLDDFAWIKKAKRRKPPKSVLPARAELLEQARLKDEADAAALAQAKIEKAKKKSKKKRKGSSYFDLKETLQLVAGVSALVALLAFLAWGYPGIRFPMGGMLCVIGFIVYLLGSSSLRRLVADEGFLKLLLYRFCPPYQWWYIIRNWEETKDFFAFFVAGYVILAIGGGIISTSEEGRRAEIADRAHQKLLRERQKGPPSALFNSVAPPPAVDRRDRDGD